MRESSENSLENLIDTDEQNKENITSTLNINEIITEKESNSNNEIINKKRLLKNKRIKDFKKLNEKIIEFLKSDEQDEILSVYQPGEEITKKVIKPNISKNLKIFMFRIFIPVFTIINLIGVFETLAIFRIFSNVLKNSISHYFHSIRKSPGEIEKFSIVDFNKNYNFYALFYEDTKKEPYDFDVIKITGFIGGALLIWKGLRIASLTFFILNIVVILMIRFLFVFTNYNEYYNTYSEIQIFWLIISWIMLLIGVGASALLFQKMVIDKTFKYKEHLEKLEERNNNELEKKTIFKWKISETVNDSNKNDFDLIDNNNQTINNSIEKNEEKKIYLNNERIVLNQEEEKNFENKLFITINDTKEINLIDEENEKNKKHQIDIKKSFEKVPKIIYSQTMVGNDFTNKKNSRGKTMNKKKEINTEKKPEKKKKQIPYFFYFLCRNNFGILFKICNQ